MDTYNPKHFVELIEQLVKMGSLLKCVEDKDVVRRISKNDVVVRGELKDLDIIWRRFLNDRQELIDLAPISREYFENKADINSVEAKHILARETELTNSLKVDLKSLFLFSDILFNKLILLVRAVSLSA